MEGPITKTDILIERGGAYSELAGKLLRIGCIDRRLFSLTPHFPFFLHSTMSSSAEWKEAVMSTRYPWRQFLDLSALSLPSSFSEATTRVAQNLTHFLFNYALLLIIIFLVSLISQPFPLILFLFLFAAWYFLYFSRDNEPLTLSTFLTLSDSVILACLAVLTVVILFSTGVWFNLFLSVVLGAVVACLHAALRSTDDLVGDDHESPYGPMLSDPSGDAYVPV